MSNTYQRHGCPDTSGEQAVDRYIERLKEENAALKAEIKLLRDMIRRELHKV